MENIYIYIYKGNSLGPADRSSGSTGSARSPVGDKQGVPRHGGTESHTGPADIVGGDDLDDGIELGVRGETARNGKSVVNTGLVIVVPDHVRRKGQARVGVPVDGAGGDD